MRETFKKLAEKTDWNDPNCSTSPNTFTVHRQIQLSKIFKSYDGLKIPYNHFSDEIINDYQKRNQLVFPVVFAYICGILKTEDDGLIKPADLELGKEDLPRDRIYWVP